MSGRGSTSYVKQLLSQPGGLEVPPWAVDSGGQIAVQVDRGPGNPQFLLESLDKADELNRLLVRIGPSIAISNKADTYGMLVVMSSLGTDDMGSRKLVVPAIPGVDFPVTKAVAIADHEVISEALVPVPQVLPVDSLRGTERRSQVVNDDSRPALAVEGGRKIEERITPWIDLIKVLEVRQWKATRCH